MSKNTKKTKKYAHFQAKIIRNSNFLYTFVQNLFIMIKNKKENLISKMGYLFSKEEMYPRESAIREEVINAISPLADDIVNGIIKANNSYLAFADTHAIARRQNNFVTTTLHGLIIEQLATISSVEIQQLNNSGNSILRIGKYLVWLKKLDDKGMPNINKTKSSTKRINQLVDGNDTTPLLILGYTLDDIQRINGISLSYLEGEKQLWAPIDIMQIISSKSVAITSEADETVNVTVKPGKKRKSEVV